MQSGLWKASRLTAISVVMPAFNSAQWLASTIASLAEAARRVEVPIELVVVDDGSTDDTLAVLDSIRGGFPGTLRVVSQKNLGRFRARLAGLEAASNDHILLMDSRVLIEPDALGYLVRQSGRADAPTAWNGHVPTVDDAPLIGRFWEVPVQIFWRRYLRRPRPFDLTTETFDQAPKGTGLFFAPRDLLRDVFREAAPEGDAHLMSDDTRILRAIAQRTPIRLDPGFAGWYRPRTTYRAFISHTYQRGTLFVDSYAGTGTARSVALLIAAAAPGVVVAVIVGLIVSRRAGVAIGVGLAGVALAALPSAVALRLGVAPRAALAYLLHLPSFVVPFWGGLVRGIVVHRRAFLRRNDAIDPRSQENS